MIKNGNNYIKPKKVDYQDFLNVWVDDTKRLEIVKTLMITDKNFNIEKLRTNPVYHNAYTDIIVEKQQYLTKLDKSWLWSRKFTPQRFKDFIIPFSIYSLVVIPYIFYKVLQKRILEYHVKYGYDADRLKGYDYWNLDFENKDIYPDSVIKIYFEVKKKNNLIEKEKQKALTYSDKFVDNISKGYLTDFTKRRKSLGFDDDQF
jgi:hypothetical protein